MNSLYNYVTGTPQKSAGNGTLSTEARARKFAQEHERRKSLETKSAYRSAHAAETREAIITRLAAGKKYRCSWANKDKFFSPRELDEIGSNRNLFMDIQDRIKEQNESPASYSQPQQRRASNVQPSLSYTSSDSRRRSSAQAALTNPVEAAIADMSKTFEIAIQKPLEDTAKELEKMANDFYKTVSGE